MDKRKNGSSQAHRQICHRKNYSFQILNFIDKSLCIDNDVPSINALHVVQYKIVVKVHLGLCGKIIQVVFSTEYRVPLSGLDN